MENIIGFSLGGYVFQGERAAYERLRSYLDALIGQCGTSAEGRDVVHSIEERFAELLSRRGADGRTVTIADIEQIITQIGDVEGMNAQGEGISAHAEMPRRERFRLYRDTSNRVLGGVCAGVSARTGIPVWAIRLLFVLATLYYGFSIVLYCILWFAIPEAVSAKERAEMRGQPLTFNSIRDEVRTQYDAARRAMRGNGLDGARGRGWGLLERLGYALGTIALGLLKALFIGLGVMLIIASLVGVFAGAVGIWTLIAKMHYFLWFTWESEMTYLSPLGDSWLFQVLVIPTVLIPLGFLFMLGLHMITRLRIRLLPSVIFLAIWICSSVGLIVWSSVYLYRCSEDVAQHESIQPLELYGGDTLHIQSDLPVSMGLGKSLRQLLAHQKEREQWFKHRVEARICYTKGDQAYVQVVKHALSPNEMEGQMRLKEIEYTVRVDGDSLYLPAQFGMIDGSEASGREWVEVEIYLPEGAYLQTQGEANLLFARYYGRWPLNETSAIAKGQVWWPNGKSYRLQSDAQRLKSRNGNTPHRSRCMVEL